VPTKAPVKNTAGTTATGQRNPTTASKYQLISSQESGGLLKI